MRDVPDDDVDDVDDVVLVVRTVVLVVVVVRGGRVVLVVVERGGLVVVDRGTVVVVERGGRVHVGATSELVVVLRGGRTVEVVVDRGGRTKEVVEGRVVVGGVEVDDAAVLRAVDDPADDVEDDGVAAARVTGPRSVGWPLQKLVRPRAPAHVRLMWTWSVCGLTPLYGRQPSSAR